MKFNNEEHICWATEDRGIKYLTDGVNEGKRFLTPGHNGGGSFLINEYKQVIVPSSEGDSRRVIVGQITGDIKFYLENNILDLKTLKKMEPGILWERPYIGIPYNLSASNRIYFKRDSEDGTEIEYLKNEYAELIKNLRKIRPYGAVRFIVNPYGLVLTKINIDNTWKSVFVQKLDYDKWFPMEE
ncbi:hypothetical protein [Thermodesulfovibrio sp.]|uniref:hypothetical protein n=1 Tax=Thermodesulfovibrio sp. TaxID=2067987 RepID=UPI0030ECFDF6